VDATTAGITALVASYSMMKAGHVVGSRVATSVGRNVDTGVVSGGIFACLAVMQFAQFLDLGSE